MRWELSGGGGGGGGHPRRRLIQSVGGVLFFLVERGKNVWWCVCTSISVKVFTTDVVSTSNFDSVLIVLCGDMEEVNGKMCALVMQRNVPT